MNRHRLLWLCRFCVLSCAFSLAVFALAGFVGSARGSYHAARELERLSDRMVRKWERGFGETIEQAKRFREWPASWGAQQGILRTTPYAAELRALWDDQPLGLCFRYPVALGAKCRAVNIRGYRWGWFLACWDAVERPGVICRGLAALLWAFGSWLTFRISPPDDGRDDESEPWAPQPRWPGRNMRPVTGDGRPAAPLIHGWN